MTTLSICAFKEQIMEPTLEDLIENAPIKDGCCYINNLEIVFTDKRSYGHNSYVKAQGLLYKNGSVSEYSYEKADIDLGVLIKDTKNCTYLLDGKFRFYDTQINLEIKSDIKNIPLCTSLYPELHAFKNLSHAGLNTEWLKLKKLYKENGNHKPSLEQLLNGMKNGVEEKKKSNPSIRFERE